MNTLLQNSNRKTNVFLTILFLFVCNTMFSATYYSKATGNLNLTSTWGTATDGTGTAPVNFTTNGNVFFIRNNANPTISANWTVSGSGSKVVLGDGINPCNFTVGGALVLRGTIDASANATITLTTTGTLNGIVLGTLANTSTVHYAGANQTIRNYNYGNLNISGTGIKSWNIGGTGKIINGNLNINSGVALTISGNRTLSITGITDISGTINLTTNQNRLFTGDITLNSGGIWNETAAQSVTFAGSLTNNATTFTANTGVHTFSGAAKTISGATALVIPSVAITGTRSIVFGTTVTVNTALSGAGALTNLGILNSGGTVSTTTLANAGTMTKSGTGTMTTVLANLTNIGILNLIGSGAIRGITNNAGGIVNIVNAGTITSFNNATATSTLNISDLTVPTITTLTATTAGNTVNYSGAGRQTVKATTYSKLNLSGGNTKTFSTTTTVANMLSIASGTNVNLTTARTHSCVGLSLGGVSQSTGAYGGTRSTGTTINTTYFTTTSGKINNNCTAVVITTQPATPTTTCNANAIQTITVAATGTGLIYSWRKASIAITNGGVFSGQGTPTLTLTNPTVADVGSYDVVVSSSCASSVTSTAVTVSVSASATWTGVADTSWANAANWSSCGVPNSNSNVIINFGANEPIIASNVTINSLTIDSEMTLTVNSGNNLTVTNTIINEGALTIKNNANLIQTDNVVNTGAGVTTVERESSLLFRLDYTLWSSPVTGTQTLGGFSPLTSTNRFYEYNTAANLYTGVARQSSFELGKGYLIRMPNTWVDFVPLPGPPVTPGPPASWVGVFTGTPNNGDITISGLAPGQFYAVGNPYPSTIDADLFLNGSPTDGTLYFWRKTNSAAETAYATYTLAGGAGTSAGNSSGVPNGTIQVGQGFLVKTDAGIGIEINFNNLMRVANTTNQFFRTKKTVKNRIWLNLSKGTTPVNQMLVAYMTGATHDVDKAIDGKYFNDSQTALNSLINNDEFAIQGRSLPFDGTDSVPLAFKTATDGNFTIAIDRVDGLFASGQDIYLVDSKTGTETNLKTSPYSFTAASGVDNSRFSLKYQKTLNVDDAIFSENNVTVYTKNGSLYVNSGEMVINSVLVYDFQGRLIAERNNMKATAVTLDNLKASNQVLLVKVSGENNQVVTKKVVN